MMKTNEITRKGFSEIAGNDMTGIGGGDGFAYDAGRFLRYMGIYIYEGGGLRGQAFAIADACLNYVRNSE